MVSGDFDFLLIRPWPPLFTALPLGLGTYPPLRFILGKGGAPVDLAWPAIGCPPAVAVARQISVVFGQRTQLWWDLPTIESF